MNADFHLLHHLISIAKRILEVRPAKFERI